MAIVPLLNLSLNETLSRTMVTSLSILLALAMLLILGPPVIFGLTIAIFFGIFVGTYSSIYISSPVLVWLGVEPDSFLRSDDKQSPPRRSPPDPVQGGTSLSRSSSRPCGLASPGAHANEVSMLKISRTALLFACAAIPLAACATGKTGKSDTQYVARDVSTLYTAAKRTMD